MAREIKNQMRVIIRYADARPDDSRLVPASVFKKQFNAFYNALAAAAAEANGPERNDIFISDLRMGSNEVAMVSPSGIAPLMECFTAVYRNDFPAAIKKPTIAKKIARIGKIVDQRYSTFVEFNEQITVPIDSIFCRQAKAMSRLLVPGETSTQYFAGSAIDTFDGMLGEIDALKPVWTGQLALSGGKIIQCMLDKSKGEDAFNRFWNKRVWATGRAIYNGSSRLPVRLDVLKLQEIEKVDGPVSIEGIFDREFETGETYEQSDIQ